MITFSPNTVIKSADVNQNFTDLASGAGDVTANSLTQFRKELLTQFGISGFVVPTSASLSTTIAAGATALVNGSRITFANSIVRSYTASKDTYGDLKDDGTITYVEVSNGATVGMTLSTNSDGTPAFRFAKVVSSVSAITTVTQSGLDPLGNPIFNRDPSFYANIENAMPNNTTLSASAVDLNNTTQIVNIPSGFVGVVEVEVEFNLLISTTAIQIAWFLDGVSQSNPTLSYQYTAANADYWWNRTRIKRTVAAGAHTFKMQGNRGAGGTGSFNNNGGGVFRVWIRLQRV